MFGNLRYGYIVLFGDHRSYGKDNACNQPTQLSSMPVFDLFDPFRILAIESIGDARKAGVNCSTQYASTDNKSGK